VADCRHHARSGVGCASGSIPALLNPMNTYYFCIPEASVLEFVQAPTLLKAKESTTEEWLPYLSQMEWITDGE
jgi:hypothetical protein